MKKGYKDLVAEASAVITTYSVDEAKGFVGNNGTLFIDLREETELIREGRIPGAVHVPRGMLEFVIDPASPNHNSVFASDKQYIFYCASGGRSALAARVAQEMGLEQVAHISGGLKAWKEVGAPTEAYQPYDTMQ